MSNDEMNTEEAAYIVAQYRGLPAAEWIREHRPSILESAKKFSKRGRRGEGRPPGAGKLPKAYAKLYGGSESSWRRTLKKYQDFSSHRISGANDCHHRKFGTTLAASSQLAPVQ